METQVVSTFPIVGRGIVFFDSSAILPGWEKVEFTVSLKNHHSQEFKYGF